MAESMMIMLTESNLDATSALKLAKDGYMELSVINGNLICSTKPEGPQKFTIIINNAKIYADGLIDFNKYIASTINTPIMISDNIKIFKFDLELLNSRYSADFLFTEKQEVYHVPYKEGQTSGEILDTLYKIYNPVPEIEREFYELTFAGGSKVVKLDEPYDYLTYFELREKEF